MPFLVGTLIVVTVFWLKYAYHGPFPFYHYAAYEQGVGNGEFVAEVMMTQMLWLAGIIVGWVIVFHMVVAIFSR